MRLGKYLSSLTKPELERIKLECNFSELEESIYEYLSKDYNRVEISYKLNISTQTIDRRIVRMKEKIERIDKIGKNTNLAKNNINSQ